VGDPVADWVHKLNKLAAEMDDTAAMIHQSAWPEALRGQSEQYRKLAQRGACHHRRARKEVMPKWTMAMPILT
jgi:hypothetical protein